MNNNTSKEPDTHGNPVPDSHSHSHPLVEQFESMVTDAIDNIPDIYQDKMKTVAIVVDDEPSQQQRSKLGLRRCDALFGLYEGVPLTKRGGSMLSIQPDIITIFKYPMVFIHTTEKGLREQIYETVWHEVAHYFGLNHAQIHGAKKKQ